VNDFVPETQGNIPSEPMYTAGACLSSMLRILTTSKSQLGIPETCNDVIERDETMGMAMVITRKPTTTTATGMLDIQQEWHSASQVEQEQPSA
jgi:hypothetical protein